MRIDVQKTRASQLNSWAARSHEKGSNVPALFITDQLSIWDTSNCLWRLGRRTAWRYGIKEGVLCLPSYEKLMTDEVYQQLLPPSPNDSLISMSFKVSWNTTFRCIERVTE